jgi:hypothetical protein
MIAAAKIASAPSGDPVLSRGSGVTRQWAAPVIGCLRWAAQVVRQLGPYAAIELLLPGGSLLAIVLWLYRRRRLSRADIRPIRETKLLFLFERAGSPR